MASRHDETNPVLTILGALARHAMTVVGGYYVAKGNITASDVQAIGGGLTALVGLGWSFFQKKKSGAL